ncbi:hypothetical protein GGI20_003311 [Coemansia sp. BCRC 34301]|nr:hypothetical protein GGI20_003311 [Coemansia sp. BCRC 34301]
MENHWIEGEESNVVFLGNVGFDTTEEQLKKVLELAGPVLDIRLVFDPMSNRSRGFGFCQFVDSSVASSAIKNLNDTMVDGRNIKIGYADRARVQRYFSNISWTFEHTPSTPLGGVERVCKLMEGLDGAQKNEFVAQFRSFAGFNTTKAKEELVRNPGLAHALVCALEGSVDPATIARIRGGMPGGGSRGLSAGYQDSPRSLSASLSPATAVNRFSASPSVPQSMLPRQPMSAAPVPPPRYAEPEPMEMDNTEVLKQLLSLTDEQLAQLPEEHRQQIVDLKRQLESAQP